MFQKQKYIFFKNPRDAGDISVVKFFSKSRIVSRRVSETAPGIMSALRKNASSLRSQKKILKASKTAKKVGNNPFMRMISWNSQKY